jgi:hypothetical protein
LAASDNRTTIARVAVFLASDDSAWLTGEFEREMIVARVNAGLARADAIARDGHFISKGGKKRQRFGRPNADPKKLEAARCELAKRTGVLKTPKLVDLGTGTVQRLKHAMMVA